MWDHSDERSVELSAKPLYIVRAPSNDVVVDDPTVSGRHAALWTDGQKTHLEDLRSRNGTFVNGRAIVGTVAVMSGDQVRLGETVTFSLRAQRDRHASRALGLLLVDDGSIAVPIHANRIRIGPSAMADVRIEGVEVAVIGIQGPKLWIDRAGESSEIALDERFEVGGCGFRIVAQKVAVAATHDVQQTPFPYILEVSLAGARAQALMIDRDSGRRHNVTAPTRASLLWVLAQGVVKDTANGLPLSEVGWCDGRALRIGVWGREAADSEERLNVLVHRTRKELGEAGFDPSFLERRHAQVRARVAEAKLS